MTDPLKRYALRAPSILLPDARFDLQKWAVIACDQYTSQRGYWDELDSFVGGEPSALRIVFPECYLGMDDALRIHRINRAMEDYREGVLLRRIDGFILVERETSSGPRLGLVAEVDLEQYDFAPGTAPLIRPTEGTIEDRLPPRIEIRRRATLESSHVLLLADDPGFTLIEPLYETHKGLEPVYDFTLYGGQRIRGWAVGAAAVDGLLKPALETLFARSEGLLFAVGDGNHSLATAKRVWQSVKNTLPEAQWENHPARYALVEIGNLHAETLAFEPIHRAVFGANVGEFAHDLIMILRAKGISLIACDEQAAHMRLMGAPVRFENAENPLPTANLQPALDEWMAAHPECSLDYIHGKDALESLIKQGACGIELLPFDKNALFGSVRGGGPLPRKTFSMGEARDKRYYLECRSLVY